MGNLAKEFISKKQRNLLLRSNIINKSEFTDIRAVLQDNERITFEYIQNNPLGTLIQAVIPEVLPIAQSEWLENEDLPIVDLGANYKDIKGSCDLCGKKPIRWKCPIKNQYNGTTLNVGRECAKEFGEEMQLRFKHYMKEAERAAKIKKLNSAFPGLSKTVENWNKNIEEYPIIISKELVFKWRSIGERLTEAYNGYINGKHKKGTRINIIKILEEKESVLDEIKNFVNDNVNKPFIAPQTLAKWLVANQKKSILEMIQSDKGFITWKTAHRITEESFMLDLAKKFNYHLNRIGLKIEKLSKTGKSEYIFSFIDYNFRDIKFTYNYSEFVLNYGGLVFRETLDMPLNLFDIFRRGTLFGNSTHEKVLQQIGTIAPEYKIVFKSLGDNQVIFHAKQDYFLIPYKELTEKYKNIILHQTLDPYELSNYISSARKMDKRQFKLHIEAKEVAREEAKSYK